VRRSARFVLALAMAGCGAGQDPSLDVPATAAPPSAPAPVTGYDVVLAGEGSGTASVRLVPERSEVCYEVAVEGLDDVTGAHIHRGRAGESGPVVLDLAPSDGTTWEGCAAANRVTVEEIAADPGGFYVSVHTKAFPNGAVRGQIA